MYVDWNWGDVGRYVGLVGLRARGMSLKSSHWYYIADTTPNMTVHRACAENAKLRAKGIKVTQELLKGEYVCYLCGHPITTNRKLD